MSASLAAAGWMADVNGVLQIEMGSHRREIIGIVIHVVAVARLGGSAMAAAVMGNHAIAVIKEEQQLASQSSADSGQPWLNTIG